MRGVRLRRLRPACLALLTLAALGGWAAAQAAPQEVTQEVTQEASERAALLARRQGYLALWARLEQDATLDGPARFGLLVQRVVDDAYRRAAERGELTAEAEREAELALLDDLVDILVQEAYQREKDLVMRSPSVIRGGVITESAADLAGFAPRFQAGEGRFRHFAMNAAAGYLLPAGLVEALARRVGGDSAEGAAADPSGDSAADLATNALGRAFAALLLARPLVDLADGESVARWVDARFAPP